MLGDLWDSKSPLTSNRFSLFAVFYCTKMKAPWKQEIWCVLLTIAPPVPGTSGCLMNIW